MELIGSETLLIFLLFSVWSPIIKMNNRKFDQTEYRKIIVSKPRFINILIIGQEFHLQNIGKLVN